MIASNAIMSSNDGDDQIVRFRAELIEEERKLRPIRDKISEAEKEFDSQLEALDRTSEVQIISEAIYLKNEKGEKIRKKLKALSAALEENEQHLRKAMAEANQLNGAIEKGKEEFELDRRIAMAPLYDSLHRAQAELRLERNARAQESKRARLAIENTRDNATSQMRHPSDSPSHMKKLIPNTTSDSGHETLPKGHVTELPIYIHRGSRATTRPFTRPSMTSNGITKNRSQEVTAVTRDRLSWPEREHFMNHENEHSESIQQTRVGVVESEADSGAAHGPLETQESSTTSSSLTSLSTPSIDPYTDVGSSLPSEDHGSEAVGELIEFTIFSGIYTGPECMKGVSVAKIVEGDSYWISTWTKLENWVPSGKKSAREESVTYFSTCEIHPNQLLAKTYYDGTGLCGRKYPIILQRIPQVLKCAQVDDPIQWFRHRLARLIVSHEKDGLPDSFQLKATLVTFQRSDPIYQQYYQGNRYKSIDFASIGRKARMFILFTLMPFLLLTCAQSNCLIEATRRGITPV